jgi:hypothetical protein
LKVRNHEEDAGEPVYEEEDEQKYLQEIYYYTNAVVEEKPFELYIIIKTQ